MYREIHQRFKNNTNFVAAISGKVGRGKSWAALKLCSDLDKGFDSSRICFTPTEVYKIVKDRIDGKIPRGSFIMIDEAMIFLDSDKSRQDAEIMEFKQLMQTWRTFGLGCVMTFPSSLGSIQKKVRQMIDVVFTMLKVDYELGYSYAKINELDPNSLTGKIYNPAPVFSDDDGIEYKGSMLRFNKPPQKLINAYLKLEREYKKSINERNMKAAELREKKQKASSLGDDYYRKVILKNPSLYLNSKETHFSSFIIMSRLGLSEAKARGLAGMLNNDWSNGLIKVKT